MARRRKSGLDQALDLAAKLPWKVSVALAPVFYVLLHIFAGRKPPTATSLDQMGNVVAGSMIATFCAIGQYVVPLILLIGAAVSYLKARKRRDRFELTAEHGQRSALLNMTWREFEELVAEYFGRKGFTVIVNDGSGADGGIDVELRKGNELSLVQCKQWRATSVGVDVVRQLFGVMAARGAVGGYVVTSAHFTPDAKAFADGRNIHLIDGAELIQDIRGHASPNAASISSEDPTFTPSCPKCSAEMVRRVAKRGAHAGEPFWGCQRYPICKGTRSM